MDVLSTALRNREYDITTGWMLALDKIQGAPFGGTEWGDPRQEIRVAFQALLAILERNDRKPAEEHAVKLVRTPPLRGSGVTATIRGYYALFEAVRPILDSAYPEGQRQTLPRDVERLRSAVGMMVAFLTAAHLKYSTDWQNDWDRMAFQGLRSPLAKVISELGAVSAGAGESLPQAFREVLRDALRSGRDMLNNLESLFAMHRLGGGLLEIHPEPVRIAVTLEPAVAEIQRRATGDRKTVVWQAPRPDAEVLAEREFLRRAFALLLLRAVDESAPGGTVRAEVAEEPGTTRLVVRHQSAAEPPAGAGESVEYAFARMSMEQVGGRFEVTREPGGVVTAQLRLPAPLVMSAPPKLPEPAPGAGLKIVRGRGVALEPPAPATPVTPAAEAPEIEIKIVRGVMEGVEPAKTKEPPAAIEPKPEDPAKGNIKIIREIAPGTQPGTRDKIEDS